MIYVITGGPYSKTYIFKHTAKSRFSFFILDSMKEVFGDSNCAHSNNEMLKTNLEEIVGGLASYSVKNSFWKTSRNHEAPQQ